MKQHRNKSFILLITFIFISLSFACKGESPSSKSSVLTFAKGADIGWLPQMEASGYKFLNKHRACGMLLFVDFRLSKSG